RVAGRNQRHSETCPKQRKPDDDIAESYGDATEVRKGLAQDGELKDREQDRDRHEIRDRADRSDLKRSEQLQTPSFVTSELSRRVRRQRSESRSSASGSRPRSGRTRRSADREPRSATRARCRASSSAGR